MPDSDIHAKVIVTDTGPLITLAAADVLDYLLYPGVTVYIPDAVLYEATVNSGALGAASIAAWVQGHVDDVRPIVTEAYANFQVLRARDPAARQRDLGEQAAIEAIRYGLKLSPGERAVLLTEDDRVIRGSVIVLGEEREQIIPITTRDFLVGLEAAGRINSADEVYRMAEDAGRHASRLSALAQQHEQARLAVDNLLRGSREPS